MIIFQYHLVWRAVFYFCIHFFLGKIDFNKGKKLIVNWVFEAQFQLSFLTSFIGGKKCLENHRVKVYHQDYIACNLFILIFFIYLLCILCSKKKNILVSNCVNICRNLSNMKSSATSWLLLFCPILCEFK